ncbi:MAG TPA: hypothetical protein PKX44_07995 [Methanomassiliicoccaceae archaeon]|nr:hypothetical protein [Methanomassiliicoccaceae archaeon]
MTKRKEKKERVRPRTIYIGGKFQDRERLRAIAIEMQRQGLRVTSRWLFIDWDDKIPYDHAAEWDLEDILRARAFLLIDPVDEPTLFDGRFSADSCEGGRESVGRYCEFGAALIAGKRCFYIGKPRSIFHAKAERLPDNIGPIDLAKRMVQSSFNW